MMPDDVIGNGQAATHPHANLIKLTMALSGVVFLSMMVFGLIMRAAQGGLLDLDPGFRRRCIAGEECDVFLRPCIHQRNHLYGCYCSLRANPRVHRQALEDHAPVRHRLGSGGCLCADRLLPPFAAGREHACLGTRHRPGRFLRVRCTVDCDHGLLTGCVCEGFRVEVGPCRQPPEPAAWRQGPT